MGEHFLAHIASRETLENRVRGAVSSAFFDHEKPDRDSIVKRVIGELLNTAEPRKESSRKRKPAPEKLLREVRGICGRIAKLTDLTRAASVGESVRKRIEGALSRYEIIES